MQFFIDNNLKKLIKGRLKSVGIITYNPSNLTSFRLLKAGEVWKSFKTYNFLKSKFTQSLKSIYFKL